MERFSSRDWKNSLWPLKSSHPSRGKSILPETALSSAELTCFIFELACQARGLWQMVITLRQQTNNSVTASLPGKDRSWSILDTGTWKNANKWHQFKVRYCEADRNRFERSTNLNPTIGYSLQMLHFALCFTEIKQKFVANQKPKKHHVTSSRRYLITSFPGIMGTRQKIVFREKCFHWQTKAAVNQYSTYTTLPNLWQFKWN